MKQFISFIIKEGKHIVRDSRTMLILFGMPLVLMLLFGFAISNDVKNVRMVVVTSQTDNMTRKITDALDASEYFIVTSTVPTPTLAEEEMRGKRADIAIVFSPNFADNLHNGSAKIQIMADAADPNMAVQQSNYIKQIIAQRLNSTNMPDIVNTKMLYNPQMKSAYNFVPGIMGMLLMIICTMMTSISIVREKEKGTMEVLLVSPSRPIMIIIAKAVPYFVLSFAILVLILVIASFILGVPIAGSLWWIFSVSMLYILMSLSLGLLISVVANTQLVAMLMSGMVMLLPNVLLSGMLFPIESMPQILQWVTLIVPARWYISAMRKLMIMGVDITTVTKEVSILLFMTLLLLFIALKKFKKRLE